MTRGRDRRSAPPPTEAVLVPGGAVVFDESGMTSFGISDDALDGVVGGAPDVMRLAVAHYAARRAIHTGLIDQAGADVGADVRMGEPRPPTDPVGVDDSVRLVRARGYLSSELLTAGLRARDEGVAVVPVVEYGRSRLLIGPRLTSDGRPCIACLRRAVAPNRMFERWVSPEVELSGGPVPSDVEVLSLISEQSGIPSNAILEFDDTAELVGRHHVRWFPDCAVCGGQQPDFNEGCPALASSRKHETADTGARISDASHAFETYAHLISPITGAVRRIRRVDVGAPELIHVFTASHATSRQAASFAEVMKDGHDHSGGKGSSEAQARVSALCEALERFSAVSTGGEVDVVGKMTEVAHAIDPRDCMLFSNRQYDSRETWNASQGRSQRVPEPFDERTETAWSRVWCLQTREPAYLPTGLLYYDFGGPAADSCIADSNGLAAGQTLGEAILQGFLELIERDAIALWWYNRTRRAEVAVDTFADAYVNDVIAHYESLGRRVWVLDLTSDLGVPVYAAISARYDEALPEVIFGFGAHVDPSIALRRCVTEMNQLLATAIQPRDRRTRRLRGSFDDALRWWAEASIEDHPYLVPARELGGRGRHCFHYARTDDLRDDLDTCLAVADRHGLSVYVRDMTRADLGISVAKVVVPGLRHFWRRLGPGRLYQAPVAMGDLEAPLSEHDMNPVSLFV